MYTRLKNNAMTIPKQDDFLFTKICMFWLIKRLFMMSPNKTFLCLCLLLHLRYMLHYSIGMNVLKQSFLSCIVLWSTRKKGITNKYNTNERKTLTKHNAIISILLHVMRCVAIRPCLAVSRIYFICIWHRSSFLECNLHLNSINHWWSIVPL